MLKVGRIDWKTFGRVQGIELLNNLGEESGWLRALEKSEKIEVVVVEL